MLNHTINVTPLADVMLVLLIIFIVVTPLIGQGVDVDVPQAEHPTEHPDNQTLVLSLRRDGIFLNTEPVAQSTLESRIADALARRASKILYLKADRSLDYAGVLEVMDICRRSGAIEIALITREKKPSSP